MVMIIGSIFAKLSAGSAHVPNFQRFHRPQKWSDEFLIKIRVAIKVHSHWENQNKYRRGPSIPRKKSATFFHREMSRFGIQLALAWELLREDLWSVLAGHLAGQRAPQNREFLSSSPNLDQMLTWKKPKKKFTSGANFFLFFKKKIKKIGHGSSENAGFKTPCSPGGGCQTKPRRKIPTSFGDSHVCAIPLRIWIWVDTWIFH